jgi:two-component system, NarL family, nitrate/nitrite response regulator NarL
MMQRATGELERAGHRDSQRCGAAPATTDARTSPHGDGDLIRAMIVAEVRLYRDGLARILGAEEDVDVVGVAASWPEALPVARKLMPELVLIDLNVGEGRVAVAAFRAALPTVQVVAISIGSAENDVISWAEAGVDGFVTREDSLARLVHVLRSVARGEMPCSPRMAATLLRRVGVLASTTTGPGRAAELTSRELEVVELIERGLSNKEIGSELNIEVATVKNHVHNILEKLQVSRRSDAVATVRGRAPSRLSTDG